ncbi:MAG TPA: carbohydrate kinase family protein [Actinomycetes bacterium]|jgi:sugar/nucleoside kinase (ribokinase family)|nr:carbohydrate kinase family protein [Actinomycetes bacterium]
MARYDVVVLGDVNMDYVVVRNLSFPLSSLAENGLIYWEDIDEVPGGSGLNFCAFAAEAGYSCLLLGKTGNDSAGLAVTTWLTARHIAVPRQWTTTAPTGKALILRDSTDIRLVINNRHNANHALSVDDIEENKAALASCQVMYISGYCISDPRTARYRATLQAMAHARSGPRPPAVVFDLVPHRIYEQLTFEQFRECTRHVDILISEVATMRRFLGLGSRAEAIDEPMARDTAERITKYYPRVVLRYGWTGCDQELLADTNAERFVHQETRHDQAADKRGYGDRLALSALRDFFHVLPAA